MGANKKEGQRTDSEVLAAIDGKLRVLISLAAEDAVSGMNQKDAITKLLRTGLTAREIGDALNLPPSTVAPIVSKAKATESKRS